MKKKAFKRKKISRNYDREQELMFEIAEAFLNKLKLEEEKLLLQIDYLHKQTEMPPSEMRQRSQRKADRARLRMD